MKEVSWKIIGFKGIADPENALCPIAGGGGSAELEICQNLIPKRGGGLQRRAGLAQAALFKTAGANSFKGSRNGFFITGNSYNKWCIGGDDNNVYEVPEGSSPAAVLKGSGYAPYRISFMEYGDNVNCVTGNTSHGFLVDRNGTYQTWPYFAYWRQIWVSPASSYGYIYGVTASGLSGGNYIKFYPTEDVPVGSNVYVNSIIAPCKTNNTNLIVKENGSLWIFSGVNNQLYDLRQVKENIGTPIPYSVVALERGTVFATLDNVYLWTGGNLVNLTANFDRHKLPADFDTSYLWQAGSGYDPANDEYWLTYRSSSGSWKTLVYNFPYSFWWEFVNAGFKEGSFYNKAGNFYLSLDAYDNTPPALYRLGSSALGDPNAAMVCQLKTGKIYLPASQDSQFNLRGVTVAGKGWNSLTVHYQDLEGNWQSTAPLKLDGAVARAVPPGDILGRAFKLQLEALISGSAELALEAVSLDLTEKRRG